LFSQQSISLLGLVGTPIDGCIVSVIGCLFVSIGLLWSPCGFIGITEHYKAAQMHGGGKAMLRALWLVAQLSCVAGMLTPYYFEGSLQDRQCRFAGPQNFFSILSRGIGRQCRAAGPC
jgi:hypothetical protein